MAAVKNAVKSSPCQRYLCATPLPLFLNPTKLRLTLPHEKNFYEPRSFSTFVFVGAFLLAFLSERPPLTTDLATLAGDGSTLDYCAKPTLDGTDKMPSMFRKATRRDLATRIFLCRFWLNAPSPWLRVPTTFAGFGAPCRVVIANISNALNNAATAR